MEKIYRWTLTKLLNMILGLAEVYYWILEVSWKVMSMKTFSFFIKFLISQG